MLAVAITTPVTIAPMQENSTKSISLLTIITSIAPNYRMLPAWQKRGGELSDFWSKFDSARLCLMSNTPATLKNTE